MQSTKFGIKQNISVVLFVVFLLGSVNFATAQKVILQSTIITDTSIGLTWEKIPKATGYNVSKYCWPDRGFSEVSKKTLCETIHVSENHYNATSLIQNRYYEFVVTAIINGNEAPESKSKEYRVATKNGPVINNVLPSSADRELKMPFSDMALSMEYKGIVLTDPNYYYWCISPIEGDDGKIHLFTCRWAVPNYYTWDEYKRGTEPGKWTTPQGYMGGWKNICEVAHFIGESPEGPWTYVDTPISNNTINNKGGILANRGQVAPHNVRVKKIDDTYCLVYITQKGNWLWNSQYNEMYTSLSGGQREQRTCLATAPTLYGPWTLQGDNGDGVVVQAEPPGAGHWTSNSILGCDNPDIIKIDGKYRIYFKAGRGQNASMKYGYAESNELTKGYVKNDTPSTDNVDYIEDATLFEWNGKIYMLTTDNFGANSSVLKGNDRNNNRYEVGILWESQDRGNTFKLADAKIGFGFLHDYVAVPPLEFNYNNVDSKLPVSVPGYGISPKFERPAVLMQSGRPTYFYAAVPLNISGYNATQNVVMKIP